MELTYYGHACFLVEIGGTKLLFDPFITPNELAANVNVSLIKPDFILLSHGHEDHVADAESIAKQSGATLIAVFEVASWFENKGVTDTIAMNIGGNLNLDFGRVKMVNAVHSNALPDGSDGGKAAGFVIECSGKTFYFAGDTALTYDMKLIGAEFNIDFAIMPIGDQFTMNINDAVLAADFVETSTIVGMHFDTFPPIKIDHDAVQSIAKAGNKTLILPKIGEKFSI